MSEKNFGAGNAPKEFTGPEAVLGGTSGHIAQNPAAVYLEAARQAVSVTGDSVLKPDYAHILGGVRVIVQKRGIATYVSVHPRPWGMTNLDKEFPAGGGARYIAEVLGSLSQRGRKEHERREHHKDLRLAERGRS